MNPKFLSGCARVLLLLLPFNAALAQSLARAEQDLVKHLEKIESLSEQQESEPHPDLSDSIEQENKLFGNSFQKLTAEMPNSITYKFNRLVNNGLTIATSPDGLFRVYSWDAETGGTAHFFNKVYQYKVGNKVYSKLVSYDDDFELGWFSAIYMLTVNGKKYYLGISHSKVATLQSYEEIHAFRLEGKHLNDSVRIIKTQSGLTGSLGFDFVMDQAWSGEDEIHYNNSTKTIRFPVVLEGGHITKRRITYKFNGRYFVKVQ
ncbi:MAG TPA: hypothetical protein VGM41_15520 [Chitinophagaceae bacterium]|jgi:hypothetical protein